LCWLAGCIHEKLHKQALSPHLHILIIRARQIKSARQLNPFGSSVNAKPIEARLFGIPYRQLAYWVGDPLICMFGRVFDSRSLLSWPHISAAILNAAEYSISTSKVSLKHAGHGASYLIEGANMHLFCTDFVGINRDNFR